jgi:hypothetical protein
MTTGMMGTAQSPIPEHGGTMDVTRGTYRIIPVNFKFWFLKLNKIHCPLELHIDVRIILKRILWA